MEFLNKKLLTIVMIFTKKYIYLNNMFQKTTNLIKNLSFNKKLLLLFLIALLFRLNYGFYSNSFGQDVARDLVLIENKITNKDFLVSYGPKASVGNFYLPPLYYQVHLILSLITFNNPFVMKFFVIIIESLTPILLALILRLIKNKKYIWFLTLAYAVAPIPTIFGSFAWNPNTIPFFQR
jgi:hypothetical protein